MQGIIEEGNRKKFLFLAYYYPPIKSMGSMRMYFLTHELLKLGHELDLISTSNQSFLEQEHLDVRDGVNRKLARTFDYRTLSSIFSDSVHYQESTKETILGKLSVKLLNSFPFNLIVGEGGLVYILHALHLASKNVRASNTSHIVSSFRPYSDHFIAYVLKGRFPHLHWTADFRDIHIDVLKDNVVLSRFQRWCNKKILSRADLVTTVSKGCADHFAFIKDRLAVLHNGLPEIEMSSQKLADLFTITFTGSLYGNRRDPDILLKALAELRNEGEMDGPNVQVVYAGKDSERWKMWMERAGLTDIGVSEGLVSYARSIELQQKSHVNLMLTFSHDEVKGALTGKLFEYLAVRRPIVTIINGPKDIEIEAFINRYEAGEVFYAGEDITRIKRYLKEKYQAWKRGEEGQFTNNSPLVEELRWENLTEKFNDLLDGNLTVR